MVEQRGSGSKQAAVPSRRRAANPTRVQTNDRETFTQQLVDARQTTAAETHHARVGAHFTGEYWIRLAAARVPDRRGEGQKYVAKEANSRAKSLRLLNRSYAQPRTSSILITDSLVGRKLTPPPA